MAEVLTIQRAGYDEDFYLWTQEQAAALRSRDDGSLDWANLAEEIESLGRRDRRELDSRFVELLLHLIKWQYQPAKRCGGWQSSIRVQCDGIRDIIGDSPSLRRRPAEKLAASYDRARYRAFVEMGLLDIAQIPDACPFDIDEICDDDWLPR